MEERTYCGYMIAHGKLTVRFLSFYESQKVQHQVSIFFGTVPPSLCVFFSFKFCPFSCSLTKNRCRRWQLHRPTTETYFDFNSMENIITFNLLHCSSFVAVCVWTAMLNFGEVSIVKTTEIWCSIKHEIGEQEANRSKSDELVFGQNP